MFTLRSRSYVLLPAALVLMALPVFGQETQQSTSAVEPAKSSESISKSPDVSAKEKEQNSSKLSAVPEKKLSADKTTLSPNETKPAAVDSSVDASQAAPAPQDDTAELAKKLANPISSMISFPIQTNFDMHMGTGNGWRMTMNVQPVIPVALNANWNLISRTVIPIIHQGSVIAPGTSQSGLGDTLQSFWFSPNKSEPFIWGVGAAILVPTATNTFLGGKQLGLGPTIVMLKQQHGWTVGMLWNHPLRVAGSSDRAKVNFDFIQPFLSYSTRDGWSYSLNTESSYDWTRNHWSVPIHFTVQKVVRFGKQPMQFGGALRCWATSPSGGPEGCGVRVVVTALFPKKPK